MRPLIFIKKTRQQEKRYNLKKQGQSQIRGVQWQIFDPTIKYLFKENRTILKHSKENELTTNVVLKHNLINHIYSFSIVQFII